MSYFLHIETAVSTSSICLTEDDKIIGFKISPEIKDSASWIHKAIKELIEELGIQLADLAAISVSAGPGSYTGLRVGMATAKGLCYALNIPLILVGTLKLMASVVDTDANILCPMIDARRMEVFTALYDNQLHEHMRPVNMVLDPNSFKEELERNTICFFGNGSQKFEEILSHQNAIFKAFDFDARNLGGLAFKAWQNKEFADLAYSEPYYVKDFYTVQGKRGVRRWLGS